MSKDFILPENYFGHQRHGPENLIIKGDFNWWLSTIVLIALFIQLQTSKFD